jgi:hypothetical protein
MLATFILLALLRPSSKEECNRITVGTTIEVPDTEKDAVRAWQLVQTKQDDTLHTRESNIRSKAESAISSPDRDRSLYDTNINIRSREQARAYHHFQLLQQFADCFDRTSGLRRL